MTRLSSAVYPVSHLRPALIVRAPTMQPRFTTRVLPILLAAWLLALATGWAAAPTLEEGRAHWAFQPLCGEKPPAVKNGRWPRSDLDRFVLAQLEQNGLAPAPEADPATLIRRVTLDLTGLPPTPEEVEGFAREHRLEAVRDSTSEAASAYERLLDRLLASPRYGERWGRHWLDLARYADTSGFHNDLDRPYAWKYRDYVIQTFNDDKPYARFIAEQIAGDEIEGASDQTLIATGFCRNGPSNDDNMGKTREAIAQYRADLMDDVISTTSSVFLGLTIGCARCHDHKTEPLRSRDYYSLVAIFNGTERRGLPTGATDAKDRKIPDAAKMMALIETRAEVPPTHIHLRGSAANHGEEVGPAMPEVLAPQSVEFPAAAGASSLRRKTLAEWIAAPDNPLTWRVMANRVWQHHFGAGIVSTPSNFGLSGMAPAAPELLDWLARQLIASGGRLKALHKLILMSATYRQSTDRPASGSTEAFPEALRPALRRMEAEVIRDSILAVSGRLNLQAGGPGIKPRIRAELLDASQRNKWPVIKNEGPEQWRRSIYIYVKRQLLMPSLELFDAPATTDSCALRTQSTVPTQALVLMNDEFVEEQAGFLARRAAAEAPGSPRDSIKRLLFLTLARRPEEAKVRQALQFVNERQRVSDEGAALRDLAHVLLNSSEFLFIR